MIRLTDLGFQVREPYSVWCPFGDAVVLKFQHDLRRWKLDRFEPNQFYCVQPQVDRARVNEIIRDSRTVSLRGGELWFEPVVVNIDSRWLTMHDGHHRLVAHWQQYRACPPFRVLSVNSHEIEALGIRLPGEIANARHA